MKTATKTADALFGLIVRAKGSCENCGDTFVLQCAHGFSRRYRNTRWDLANAWCLCRACHMYFTHHPIEWDDWMIHRLGIDAYSELRGRALSSEKPDLPSIISGLREMKEALT